MFKKLFYNPLFLKILSFFMALILWVFVNTDLSNQTQIEGSRTFYNIPITLQNLENGLVVTNNPGNVDVVIRGSGNTLNVMMPQDLTVFVDLKGLRPGTHTVRLAGTSPRGTRIVNFNPRQVVVEIDEVISLQLPVEVEITGEPEEGMVVGVPEVTPPGVFAQGPRKNVQKIARVSITVDVSGAAADIEHIASLKAYNNNNEPATGVSLTPETVEVLVPIGYPVKEVPVKVILEGEPEEGFTLGEVTVSPAQVEVTGPEDILAEVRQLETEPLSIEGLTETFTADVALIVPEGLEIEAGGGTITVTVEIS
ncbi:MAG TPA: hypothetical protein GX697_00215 [Firmicutes bacterium]|nr:hypothetical protein [Bacillota bacterium]